MADGIVIQNAATRALHNGMSLRLLFEQLRDIRTARPLVRIPILRKYFIIDEYQLVQACIVGADAVLLIAACLSPEQCSTLTFILCASFE